MNENPSEASGGQADASLPTAGADSKGRTSAVVAIAIVAGLLAGLLSWAIAEPLVEVFQPPGVKTIQMGREVWTVSTKDQAAADSRNATLAFAMMGAVLGAGLGCAGGLARRSVGAGVKAGLAGLVLGGVLAAASSLALLPFYYRAQVDSEQDLSRDLTFPLIVLGGIWATAGLAGGVGFGLGMGADPAGLARAGLGGAIGAALGTVLYVILGALVFSEGDTTDPLAEAWFHRLMARVLVATMAGALASTFAVLTPARSTRGRPS